jgi:glycosyltransferase involved in cell wall biosynthesis
MTQRSKVVHLTTVHTPTDNRILHRECATLAEAGYDVTIIAVADGPADLGGVRLRALPAVPGRVRRMVETTGRAFTAALEERAALYHFHDPELLPIGILLKAAGKRVVYDAHEEISQDLLTKHYLAPAVRPAIARAAGAIEQAGAFLFDGVVAATPAIARQFAPEKTALVQNFPKLSEITGGSQGLAYEDRPLHAAFIGVMTPERGIEPMIRGVHAARSRHPDTRLVLAGKFWPPEFEARLRAMPEFSVVDDLGWQSRGDLAAVLSRARVGLVLFQPGPNHTEAMPNKLFEYMAAGLPIIASDFPLWRSIVESAGCGLLVDPASPSAIGEAAGWIFDHPEEAAAMGRAGLVAVRERFTWEGEGAKLVALYRRILGAS